MSEENKVPKFLEQTPVVKRELAKATVMMPMDITHPLRDEAISVRLSDWTRLKRLLERAKRQFNTSAVWWSLFLGLSVACLFDALTLHLTPNADKHVFRAKLGGGIVFAVLAAFLLLRDFYRKQKLQQDLGDIEHEINGIDAAVDLSPPPSQ